MKTSLLLIFLFSFFGFQSPGELTVTVSNISPLEGDIYIAIYDNREDYMSVEAAVFSKVVPVENGTQSIVFTDVPHGEYAVSVFQDLDDSGDLSMKTFGPPKEPYGFSNNVRGKIGPPSFENAKISFAGSLEIEIELVNKAKK